MGLREGAAEDREVLAEHEDQAAVDGAVAGHHAVAGDLLLLHAEVEAAVLDIHVPLLEGALVEQDLQALARGQLALGVLRLDALLAAADRRLRAHRLEPLKYVLHGAGFPALFLGPRFWQRSEEHTSELQSLMRISYAVLCLNKK